METPVTILSDGLTLEGLLQRQPGDCAVVITHPHSLYGGDMHNPVVDTIRRVYQKRGFSTLRFNFRGVGASGGTFDNGCGEENDVLGAVQFLVKSGLTCIHLAGYSFGARVLAGISTLPPEVIAQIYVAPPVAFMDFSGVDTIEQLKLVIAGDCDDIGPAAQVQNMIGTWNSDADLAVLPGCDHFFSTAMDELADVLAESLR